MKSCCLILSCLLFFTSPTSSQTRLYRQVDSCARLISGHVGVYTRIIETGHMFSYNGRRHFPMQSVYKLPIAITVLDAVDKGKLRLDQLVHVGKADFIPAGRSPIRDQHPDGLDITIRDLIRYSIVESDGSASDVLCRELGGIRVADDYVHNVVGFSDMHLVALERVQVTSDSIQYKNWATPEATTQLMTPLYRYGMLSDSSRKFLLELMTASIPGAHRLKGLLPPGTIVAHKTGTSGTDENGLTRATNDAGIITLPNGLHLCITVYISDSHASEEERELTIARIAKILFDHFRKVSPGSN